MRIINSVKIDKKLKDLEKKEIIDNEAKYSFYLIKKYRGKLSDSDTIPVKKFPIEDKIFSLSDEHAKLEHELRLIVLLISEIADYIIFLREK